ncbi:UDP-N-acetylmuramoyl-tripeptide--D-alanyl-D-alanine ligase [Marinobacter halophilus]|uniref:UDP-N-acetylmuramoyl-tripeptide--D-alanyl-D-alanine ligase n=1 Tax=Marinobacter halophilus TaxID=1323740 RepID=A0A2T1KCL7_9GAMM|nr:UDP-N-acetylmuramoyl-tripeptide--D-alanyl-D-alanine ligase [Marinobacter halophilus]PSF07292.1 UDP-N-acetylmuramoyl-tripeptide--D-alanyl-D-alanine ligase [Marinobacter halophilus]GGC82340.1 UDP-N-acetylmuramoyl-tripeptide--D-alanyl-D-alanine ligase [Marinobacter halophilus]
MMRAFSLAQARDWLQATMAGTPADADSIRFDGVSTDTRSVGPGQLFVALRGEHFDGHEFLAQAQAQGAIAAVVDTEDGAVAIPQLVVADTVNGLAQLAAGNRNESGAQLVAVTGSSGKTTVREMTSAILAGMGSTLATEGNLNNHIGVPLTLFRLAPEHRYGAIELGASGLGEIAHTVAVVRPTVAILTNAGQAHLEGFGSYQNIVIAKGEIIDGVATDGVVVLNRDDPAFEQWHQRAGQRKVISVSRAGHPDADYQIAASNTEGDGFDALVRGPGGWQCQVRIPLAGEHNLTNGLLALAACRALGATDQQIVEGLRAVQAVKGRLQVLKLTAGFTLIDDSYNANPASMKAAMDVLAGYPRLRVAVLGAMAELGPDTEALHRDVGAHARAQGIDRLIVVGAGGEGYAAGFGDATEMFQSHDQAVDAIVSGSPEAITVLVKGSRSSAMDRVVEGIQTKVTNTCCSG